jgi:peptidoglycan/xylan/chitin deacetylase (PgdA/CDA1 family)
MGPVSTIHSLGIRLINQWGAKDCFSVLNYHRVMPNDAQESELALTPELFEQQLIWLKRHFRVLPLPQAFKQTIEGKLPANCVVITVDDGFYDCHQYVFPLLLKHQLSATFFITTCGIESGSLWEDQIRTAVLYASHDIKTLRLFDREFSIITSTDKRYALQTITELVKYQPLSDRTQLIAQLQQQTGSPKHPTRDHMFITVEQIQQMHQQGMTIGAHTLHHPILALEEDHIAQQEISQSKQILQNIINAPVEFFAYPNGKADIDFTQTHVQMVEDAGFSAAFCTDWGVASLIQDNKFMLKRFTPWDKDPARFCLRLALSALSERPGFGWLRDKVRQSPK